MSRYSRRRGTTRRRRGYGRGRGRWSRSGIDPMFWVALGVAVLIVLVVLSR
ncbi:MAG TPA: hypothetical protein VK942_12845 [Actinomycetes bacterium]|nr:hypothetical protein [Actinomycetes bacterium]